VFAASNDATPLKGFVYGVAWYLQTSLDRGYQHGVYIVLLSTCFYHTGGLIKVWASVSQYACQAALPVSADSFSSSSLMARRSATMIFSLDAFFPVNSTKISTTWSEIVNNINSKNF
jgi:hypothetical protein